MLYTSGTTGRPKGVVLSHGGGRGDAGLARDRLALARRRSPAARAAAAPHARADRRAARRAVGRRRGVLPAVRGRRGLGAARRRHGVHGGADDVREADRRLSRRAARTPRRLVGRRAAPAPLHQRLGGAAGVAAARVRGGDRPDDPGTLRHDRDRHGAVEPLRRPARARCGRRAAARRRGRPRRRRRAAGARRGRRRAARALAAAVLGLPRRCRGDGGGLRRRRPLPHRRHRRARPAAAA